MKRSILRISLLLVGIAGLISNATSVALDGKLDKATNESAITDAKPLHDQLDTVLQNIKTPESKTLLKELLGKGSAEKFNFLAKVKDSFFVKHFAAKYKDKTIDNSALKATPKAAVAPMKTDATTQSLAKETTHQPVTTAPPVVTESSPIPRVTEAFVVTPLPIEQARVIDVLDRPKFPSSADCKFQTSSGAPQKYFISDVLGNWLNTKNGSSKAPAASDGTIKKVFVSEIRNQFPKEILAGLGMEEYVDVLFSQENNSMSLDDSLSVFSKMYTEVLEKLGLETTAIKQNSLIPTEADSKSKKLWAKIGQTTVTPFLEETFSKGCLSNEKSLPEADAAMKLILELPLDVTNGLVRRSDNLTNVPFLFDDQMNGEQLFVKITAFVNSLSPDVMEEVVAEYVRNKPFAEYVDYEDLVLLAKKDLVEYLTLLSFAPTDDLTNYFTNSIKDGLYFTFSLSSIDESITRIPGLRELIDRIMQMPKPYLKLLIKKASIIIKKTFKLFAKVDFLRNKVDLIKNKLSKPWKMLTTLPFDYTYDIYSMKKKAQGKSDNVKEILPPGESEKSLKSYLGMEDYDFSYDSIIAFLTEFAQLSNDAASAVFDDLAVRFNPLSGYAKHMYEKEQRVKQKIEELDKKYNINSVSKRLSDKFLKFVGLDENSFKVTTTPAPPSFFEKVSTELKRFPDNLLLSFKDTFSWGKGKPESPIDRADMKIPSESLTSKELLQVFYNYLNETKELGEDQKIQLVKMLSDTIKPNEKPPLINQFSSQLSGLGYWFGNTTNEVVDELTNWWSGGEDGFAQGKGKSFWKKDGKDEQTKFGEKASYFSFFSPKLTSEDEIKSTSLDDKISELEKMKRLFLERNGFANLSEKGKEEVHKAVKSMSSLVNWNKPVDVSIDVLNQQKPGDSGSKFNTASIDVVKELDLPGGDMDTKYESSGNKSSKLNFKSYGVQSKSDTIEPLFVDEVKTDDVKDLIARYKMLKFPVTLVNNVKKQLLTQLEESENQDKFGGDKNHELSKWDKLRSKFGYPVAEKNNLEKTYKFRRAALEDDLTQQSTEASVHLDQFFAEPRAKALALESLTEEDFPSDSVVAILAKFFNIR